MPHQKLVDLLDSFRKHDLSKLLNEININEWKVLLVQDPAKEYSSNVPISVDFILLVNHQNTVTQQNLLDARQKIDNCLKYLNKYKPSYLVHTAESLENYLLDNDLSNKNEIPQFLDKADTPENLILRLQRADKKKLIYTSDNKKPQASPIHAAKWISIHNPTGSHEISKKIQQLENQYLDELSKLPPDQLNKAISSITQKLNEIGNILAHSSVRPKP